MSLVDWLNILIILSVLAGIALTLKSTIANKSAYQVLLSLSLLSYLVSNVISVLNLGYSEAIKWSNLLALCFILSSLFGLIRNSKPIFARFPVYLIYLPFIIPFFFPLIIDQNVLTNLLLGTLQGGCIVVALMMYSINQIKLGHNMWQLIGSIFFLSAYVIFWFVDLEEIILNVVTKFLIVLGVIFFTNGINQSYKQKLNVSSIN